MGASFLLVKEFKEAMEFEFEMFCLGEIQYVLGMQINQIVASISICQYVENLLRVKT